MKSILIVAGEASGEMHAAALVGELAAITATPLQFFGCGGTEMRQAGVETLVDIGKLAVLGPLEALAHMGHYFDALRRLTEAARSRSPQMAILVDFPDFNLRLAGRLKQLNIPVVYFISPQVWAWRSGRINHMRNVVDHMLVILPFEQLFYAKHGVDVTYVGHPLVDRVKTTLTRTEFLQRYSLDGDRPVLSLLPGSRPKEIHYHLPILLEGARLVSWKHPVQVLLPLASSLDRARVERQVRDHSPDGFVRVIQGDTYNVVGHSEVAVVSSGTATLEAALLQTPLVTVFRISHLTWIIGQYLVRVPHYSLVNLIADKPVVPELFQSEFSAERLAREVLNLLEDSSLRMRVKMELASVRQQLGEGGAISRAASKIREWL
ncbi:MAG: lipid-A-disaccharide synthase [Acidobacteriota bacterium]